MDVRGPGGRGVEPLECRWSAGGSPGVPPKYPYRNTPRVKRRRGSRQVTWGRGLRRGTNLRPRDRRASWAGEIVQPRQTTVEEDGAREKEFLRVRSREERESLPRSRERCLETAPRPLLLAGLGGGASGGRDARWSPGP